MTTSVCEGAEGGRVDYEGLLDQGRLATCCPGPSLRLAASMPSPVCIVSLALAEAARMWAIISGRCEP
eukprot:6504868-Alexandrium_andersonii.AAC.1